MTNLITKGYEDRAKFMDKHGFSFTKPRNFKNCLVVRFPHRDIPYAGDPSLKFDYERASEIGHLWNSVIRTFSKRRDFLNNISLGEELGLPRLGIYTTRVGIKTYIKLWAIPNEYKKVQDFVLENMPSWAKVTWK